MLPASDQMEALTGLCRREGVSVLPGSFSNWKSFQCAHLEVCSSVPKIPCGLNSFFRKPSVILASRTLGLSSSPSLPSYVFPFVCPKFADFNFFF